MKAISKFLVVSIFVLFVLFTSSASYALTWDWSFGTESGTFITNGSAPVAGTYAVSDFSVTNSSYGASIGSWSGGQYEAQGYSTQAPYSFDWDGSSVTSWHCAGTNMWKTWLVFGDLANNYYYVFGWETGNINTVDQAAYITGSGSQTQSYQLKVSSGSQAVPEPATMLLLGLGLMGLAGVRRKIKK